MPSERKVRRYTAYFRGWATAFGNHEKVPDQDTGLTWLFGEDQVGLILNSEVKHVLYASFLGRGHEKTAKIRVGNGALLVANEELPFSMEANRAFAAIMDLLGRPADLHLFQTYHLVYPSGTRILTLGIRPPLPLIYREIAPLIVELA